MNIMSYHYSGISHILQNKIDSIKLTMLFTYSSKQQQKCIYTVYNYRIMLATHSQTNSSKHTLLFWLKFMSLTRFMWDLDDLVELI
jgi:hypothetical protein